MFGNTGGWEARLNRADVAERGFKVAAILRDAIGKEVDFQRLAGACGSTPSRKPPLEENIEHVRRKILLALGAPVEDASVFSSTTWTIPRSPRSMR